MDSSSSSEDEARNFELVPTFRVSRPPSAYLLFLYSVRDIVRAENPDVPVGRVISLIRARWNSLTAEQRRPFELEHARRMRRRRRLRAAAKAGVCLEFLH